MNLTKKILLAIALLKIAGSSQAMEEAKELIRKCKPVKLPSTAILRERLVKLGVEHFVDKTGIDRGLGDEEKHPIEVLAAVKESLSDYAELVTNEQAKAMSLLKPEILKTILKDSSEAVIAFEKFYSQASQIKSNN